MKADINGISKYRFDNNPAERAFVEEWKETNSHSHILEYLLSDKINERTEVTQREMAIATNVIQWLGSPSGQAFIGRVSKHED